MLVAPSEGNALVRGRHEPGTIGVLDSDQLEILEVLVVTTYGRRVLGPPTGLENSLAAARTCMSWSRCPT